MRPPRPEKNFGFSRLWHGFCYASGIPKCQLFGTVFATPEKIKKMRVWHGFCYGEFGMVFATGEFGMEVATDGFGMVFATSEFGMVFATGHKKSQATFARLFQERF